jgi:predicted membrane channel-forming protein YqfA (hemolysin III family)
MLIADGIGIVVGVMLCKRIPQRRIKWFSAIIFVLFGLVGVYEVLSIKVGLGYTTLILAILTALSAYAMYFISKRQKPIEDSKVCKKPIAL